MGPVIYSYKILFSGEKQDMTNGEIKKVVFVGGGTMGAFNSLVAATAGYQVMVFDNSVEALAALPDRQKAFGEILIENWQMPRDRIALGLKQIYLTNDPAEAAADADLLSESVFERLELKRQTHRLFDELCPPKTVMTTNTSTLLLSDIESAVRRGDRFAAMHFHQPNILSDLVAGPRTSTETMDFLKRYIKSIGMTYVLLKKERAGYLHNAMYVSFLSTGLILKILGGLDIEEIDRSWMLSQKAVGGPFGSMDHVGFNVIVDVFSQNDPEDPAREYKAAAGEFFRPYLQRGELGQKTGKGFYSYPDPEFSKPEFLEGKTENPLASKALINAVLATALTLVIEGSGDMRDVDRSWMITHRPDMGPFGMIDEKGLDVFLREMEERAALDPLFAPNLPSLTEYLKGYIEKGELGVKTGKGFYTYPDPEFKNADFLLRAE
jgi:enoyl-CoA hydratase / 3-hydroxyacyl-CoA dehydrogenase